MNTVLVDDFFSGQAAALAGGTTMHIVFIFPTNGSLKAGFEAYEKKAKKSCMDYGFHMAVTKWDETISREMELMVKEKGINSFKFFLVYKGFAMVNDVRLLEGFKKCKSLGALAMVHAENGDAVIEGQRKMIELGITGLEGHALSRPAVFDMGDVIIDGKSTGYCADGCAAIADSGTYLLADRMTKREPKDLWQEPLVPASSWTPCSDQRSWEPNGMCV